MNISILGQQGSGKGTQARLLEQEGFFNFQVGDYLRELAKKDARVSKIINSKGVLMPDKEMFELVTEYLKKNLKKLDNFVLDGYPRTVKQYELLKIWLKAKGAEIDRAVFLDISDEESIKRLSARRICVKCGTIYNLITKPPPPEGCVCGGKLSQRIDDKPKVIKKRLAVYKETTKPLIRLLKKEGLLVKVNAERKAGVIFEDIKRRLGLYDVKEEKA